MASVYPTKEKFIAIGAIKIGRDNQYESEIYGGEVSDVLFKLSGFLEKCLPDAVKTETRSISKKGFCDYVNHLVSDYKTELKHLESVKNEKGIEHITTDLLSIMRKRPELDELANSLPFGDKYRKELLKKIYLLDQQISSISEGMDPECLEKLRYYSSCEMDVNVLDIIKKDGITSDIRKSAERNHNQN